ncbi:hypothetical protein HY492_00440 [Candidatus Woesearchaeota archaeon]|nr:hypothetical protein [Candidatus Woesearchaeota archaeon]
MKPVECERLCWSTVQGYGDRKKPGRVSFLYHAETGHCYVVPREIEHKDYLCLVLDLEAEAIRANPSVASRIIPFDVDLKLDQVVSLRIGRSGIEPTYHVTHSVDDLKKTFQAAHRFVSRGEIPVLEHLVIES